jgi:hypothetical protein
MSCQSDFGLEDFYSKKVISDIGLKRRMSAPKFFSMSMSKFSIQGLASSQPYLLSSSNKNRGAWTAPLCTAASQLCLKTSVMRSFLYDASTNFLTVFKILKR